MLDIRLIRENPDKINELLKKRNPELSVNEVIEVDKQRRELQVKADNLRAQRKISSQEIGKLKKERKDTEALQDKVRQVGEEIKELEIKETELNKKQKDILLNIPNIPDITTPVGSDETANVIIKTIGKIPQKSFEIKPHWEIGVNLGLLDFERGVKISESRFTVYKGAGARLERAIINFFLDIHTQNGYTEYLPPYLVNADSMTGTGQLPKFKEDMYKCEKEDLYLIPTAEVPLTNIYADEIFKPEDLPVYMTAYTPCFRREAGSAGKDTRGLIRQHQFNKVELVKLCTPDTSAEEHEKLTCDAEKILDLLELPYRRVELCTGDLGFSAKKCFDIEVWLPSSDIYREISSCSNFDDYQARRTNLKYRSKATNKSEFLHTINGSGLAAGRTFAAILENCQQEDGSISVPKVLQSYFGSEFIK